MLAIAAWLPAPVESMVVPAATKVPFTKSRLVILFISDASKLDEWQNAY